MQMIPGGCTCVTRVTPMPKPPCCAVRRTDPLPMQQSHSHPGALRAAPAPQGTRGQRRCSGKDSGGLEAGGGKRLALCSCPGTGPSAFRPPPPPPPPSPASPGDRQRPGPARSGSRPVASAARGPLPSSPCRRRRRCRCRCAESARSPPEGSGGTDRSRGSWRAPGAPRLPPGQGRGGAQGATRRVGAAAGPPAPPSVTIARLHAAAAAAAPPPPHAAAADHHDRPNRPRPSQPAAGRARVTPTRRGERSQPLAPGETPTWLPLWPLLPLPLLRLLHSPPPFPGPSPTAQPRSR